MLALNLNAGHGEGDGDRAEPGAAAARAQGVHRPRRRAPRHRRGMARQQGRPC